MNVAVSPTFSSPRRDVERLRAAVGIDKMPTDTDAWGAFALTCSVCGQQGLHADCAAVGNSEMSTDTDAWDAFAFACSASDQIIKFF